ncbi:hypothetical protein GYB29_07925 [bacterium]|nr:hypothetical protein [bacterium]
MKKIVFLFLLPILGCSVNNSKSTSKYIISGIVVGDGGIYPNYGVDSAEVFLKIGTSEYKTLTYGYGKYEFEFDDLVRINDTIEIQSKLPLENNIVIYSDIKKITFDGEVDSLAIEPIIMDNIDNSLILIEEGAIWKFSLIFNYSLAPAHGLEEIYSESTITLKFDKELKTERESKNGYSFEYTKEKILHYYYKRVANGNDTLVTETFPNTITTEKFTTSLENGILKSTDQSFFKRMFLYLPNLDVPPYNWSDSELKRLYSGCGFKVDSLICPSEGSWGGEVVFIPNEGLQKYEIFTSGNLSSSSIIYKRID